MPDTPTHAERYGKPSGHQLGAGFPMGHLLAMFDAAHEFGQYPIQTEAPLEELEQKYAGYWEHPWKVLNEEGIE